MLKPGDEVGQYTVEALIGEGGMARVFRVRHRALGSVHALKLLSMNREDIAERLVREGQIQATMRHPHVVTVTDLVEHEGRAGLIMEFYEGGTLEDLIQREGALSPERALALLLPVVQAVAFAHARGVLHRDLKPENVLLDAEAQRAYVADFGVGKALEPASPDVRRTRAGTAMGTPGYMAPEQWADAASVDASADVYSLGIVLYEALSGARAFPAQDVMTLMRLALDGEVKPLPELAPRCPGWLVAVVHRALWTEPKRRFSDAGALAEALEEGKRLYGVEGEGVGVDEGEGEGEREDDAAAAFAAAPRSSASLLDVPDLDDPPTDAPTLAGPPAAPRRLPLPVLALLIGVPAVLGFTGLFGVLWLLTRGDAPPPPAERERPRLLEGRGPRVAEDGSCLPGGRGELGYWYAGRWGGLSKGQEVPMRRATNVRQDYPREDNGHDARAQVVCVLPRGQKVRLSEDPIRVGGGVVWVPIRAQDLVED